MQRGGLGDHKEPLVGVGRQGHLVEGQGGEVRQQGLETVDGESFGSGLGVGLGFGAVRDPGRLDRRGSFGPRLLAVVVLEQQGSQSLPQVPFDIIAEHAQEQVGSDPVGVIDIHRPHLEPGSLERAEGPLDPGQALVGLDDLTGAHRVSIEAGADDVEAIQAGLGRDFFPVARPTESVVGDGDIEVFLDLAAVGLTTDPSVDPIPAAVAQAPGNRFEDLLGGLQQRFPLARPLLPQAGVEAHQQAIARKSPG